MELFLTLTIGEQNVDILLRQRLAKPLVLQLLAGRSLWLQENAAMLVGMCLYTALNYLGQRFFAFRK